MAHLISCGSCGQQYRCDEVHPETGYISCFDLERLNCRPCPNTDCLRGDVARTTLARLRADPCPTCGNFGSVTDGLDEFYCPAHCEAAELWWKDRQAFPSRAS